MRAEAGEVVPYLCQRRGPKVNFDPSCAPAARHLGFRAAERFLGRQPADIANQLEAFRKRWRPKLGRAEPKDALEPMIRNERRPTSWRWRPTNSPCMA